VNNFPHNLTKEVIKHVVRIRIRKLHTPHVSRCQRLSAWQHIWYLLPSTMQVLDVSIAEDGGDDGEIALAPVQAHRVSIQEDSVSGQSTSMGNSSAGGVLAMGEVVSIVAPSHEENEDDNHEFYKLEVMGGNYSSSEDNRRLSSGSARHSSVHRQLSIPVEPSSLPISIMTEFTSVMSTPRGETTAAAYTQDHVAHREDEVPNPYSDRKPASSARHTDGNKTLASKRWWILACGMLLVAVGLLGGICGTKNCRRVFTPSASPTLNSIQQRKKLRCGILDGDEAREEFNTHLVGFTIPASVGATFSSDPIETLSSQLPSAKRSQLRSLVAPRIASRLFRSTLPIASKC
jgi:hypothetical protein